MSAKQKNIKDNPEDIRLDNKNQEPKFDGNIRSNDLSNDEFDNTIITDNAKKNNNPTNAVEINIILKNSDSNNNITNKQKKNINKRTKKSLFPDKKEYKYALILLIFILGLIIFLKFKTYLSGFLAAGTLYILLRKQMHRLHEKRKWGRKISAILIILEAMFFILIPLTGIGFLVADTFSSIKINPQEILGQIFDFINSIEERIGIDIITVENLSFIPKAGTTLFQNIISSVSSLIINFIIAVFILYFMLVEYKVLETSIKEIIPLNPENKDILAKETNAIVTANAIGIPLLAIIQGVFAYIGYLIVGVPNALIYAVLTAFASIIPIVGTMLVWVPITINFFIMGNIKAGIIIGIYGFFIIGGIDNIARFILQKKLADIHPLITVFGVLIGIPIFGFLGVIFGPLILSLFILFINMYRYEYIPNSVAEPRVTMRRKDKGKNLKILSVKKKKLKKEKSSTNKSENLSS